MTEIQPRPYRPEDLAACLAIFDGNTPPFFAPEERAEFCAFLETLPAPDRPYLVLTKAGEVIACGGLIIEAEGRASFTWGMVARARHGQRLGTRLTQARLDLARSLPGITGLALSTSQHTHGFYEGLGFITNSITQDGFGPGLDRWDMTLPLGET
ncbi:GNAT family N-acetyltransferase [Frigidibacter albus]|uniref:GNAT family N-acetyltransferase n=1 Tax=Frigidibacter albus TaxID=1465486 RepID=A0A6L8VHS6_9RHOB|nr:GNAT family N-acetyltransferase [Frigidibacter albus]MZQ89092.1 GNAT family N-acetyltransferase [Frigidibacter albus]NBE30851.1 GNAT family N-acetyltransferase [Frigidibacter albus]GGH51493.1 N-acetyltransferase [Frigidibacter albus]